MPIDGSRKRRHVGGHLGGVLHSPERGAQLHVDLDGHDGSIPGELGLSSAAEGNAELRVVVVDAATNSLTSAVRNVIVDNPPAVSLADPGANLAGSINLSASSAPDTAQVVFERSLEGAGSWTQIATDLTAPYAASFDTTGVADDRYDFRAVATDAGGFGGTSPLRTARVDNTVPSVSISDPPTGAVVGGPNVHLGSLASDLGPASPR